MKSDAACLLVSLSAERGRRKVSLDVFPLIRKHSDDLLALSKSLLTYSGASSSNISSSKVLKVIFGKMIFSQNASRVCWDSNRGLCEGILTTTPKNAVAFATSYGYISRQPSTKLHTRRTKKKGRTISYLTADPNLVNKPQVLSTKGCKNPPSPIASKYLKL